MLRWSDGCYLEDQDTWCLSGIFRDAYILHRPENGVRDIKIWADFDPSSKKASLDIYVEGSEGLSVKTALRKQRGKLEWKEGDIWSKVESEPFKTEEAKTGSETLKISMAGMDGIEPWSDELPQLYALTI